MSTIILRRPPYPTYGERVTTPQEVYMCYPVRCPRCGKTTWDGCGDHVDDVMSKVPEPERCTCPR